MTDQERKQSPHYIPEHDPDNPESGPKDKQRLQWFLLLSGFSLLAIGGGILMSGQKETGAIVMLVGLLFLLPIAGLL